VKYGVYGINVGPCAEPGAAVRVAQAAEQAGYESVWTGEHVVLPDPQAPPSPAPPEFPFLDPAVALAHLAACTERIKLATGIIILPQRNPAVLAKELASVDVVSRGRLIFGIGVGYLKPEFDALGIPFERKGPRTDEYLDAILALWTQARPAYRGEFVSFEGVQAMPRPVQRPHPPIVVGGMSRGAYRRAVTRGHGWYGFALDPEATARCVEGLEAARRECPRPAALGELEITVTPPGPLDRDLVRRYEDLGVHRLVVLALAATADAALDRVRKTATGRSGSASGATSGSSSGPRAATGSPTGSRGSTSCRAIPTCGFRAATSSWPTRCSRCRARPSSAAW
jgi:probable F420-dependent oxidoreductase